MDEYRIKRNVGQKLLRYFTSTKYFFEKDFIIKKMNNHNFINIHLPMHYIKSSHIDMLYESENTDQERETQVNKMYIYIIHFF